MKVNSFSNILKSTVLMFFIIINTPLSIAQNETFAHKEVLLLMGTRFEITAIASSETLAKSGVEAAIKEVQRIEKLISSWNPTSQTSKVNKSAGIRPVVVDKELYDLIFRALKISALTNGAFDISYASMDKLWKFDGSMKVLPSDESIKASVSKINYQNIILDPSKSTVYLKEKGMKIGFGAIGKGYAANRIKQRMLEMGISSGIANAAGDLVTWGRPESGKDWTVGIARPDKSNDIIAWLNINDMAVVTSGNYEKVIELDGVKYSHIIDPRTGYPTTGIKSVSVICSDPELSDALATSVFVLGKEEGLFLINHLEGIECMIIDDNDNLMSSKNLNLNYYSDKNNKKENFNLKIGNK